MIIAHGVYPSDEEQRSGVTMLPVFRSLWIVKAKRKSHAKINIRMNVHTA
jgi:hypothetical protein